MPYGSGGSFPGEPGVIGFWWHNCQTGAVALGLGYSAPNDVGDQVSSLERGSYNTGMSRDRGSVQAWNFLVACVLAPEGSTLCTADCAWDGGWDNGVLTLVVSPSISQSWEPHLSHDASSFWVSGTVSDLDSS